MTTTNLFKKLNKLNIPYTIIDCNGYNMDVQFIINSRIYKAGFFKGEEQIQDFCREICFDSKNQEMIRRFFKNFSQLLKYATN
jgi:hypothetical protein